MNSTKQNILVTGGAGFIGRHLCAKLIEAGNKVYCVDNLYSGRLENITAFITTGQLKFFEHDVCDAKVALDFDIDAIYHLACPASPVFYQRESLSTLRTAVIGSINMLELALKKKIPILLASTSEIYGDPLEHPQKESYWGNVNPIGDRSCYDEGKRAMETFGIEYAKKYDLDVKIIRIFNTYGPYMRETDGRVVSNFIYQALQNKPLTIYGNGEQTRSFCYISDLVQGILRVMAAPNFRGPVNLGNPDEFTVLELANMVLELSGSKSKIEYHDIPSDDPRKRKPDIALAQSSLGWAPEIKLKAGLVNTIDYFKEALRQG